MGRQTGLALVLVLWVISLLTIMAGSFALTMRRETAVVEGLSTIAQAQAIAESGLAMAEMMLLNPDANKRWRTDGSVYEVASATAKVRIRLFSEMGKIDINHANQALLQSLLSQAPIVGETKINLVNAILDWRDDDEDARPDSAELPEYKNAGLSYGPRNKAFQSIEELQLVLGMDKEVFLWLEPLVTVYSAQAEVSLEVAPEEVLQVLPDLDAKRIETYVAARLESARNNQPIPPFPASAADSISVADESSGQLADDTSLGGMYTLVVEARLADESRAIISAVVEAADGADITPFKLLKWQQITANEASLFTDAMSDLLVKQYAQPEFDN